MRYPHSLLHVPRTSRADAQLGLILAFIAGGLNAGGFLIVGVYTSHMSGLVSSLADNLVLAVWPLIATALAAISAFLGGAMLSAWLVNWARRHHAHRQYALPLALEGLLILGFGLLEITHPPLPHLQACAIALLCGIMGLQNATITKASGATIRTTHVTGITTDIGIELGKLPYGTTDFAKLRLLTSLLTCFFSGGILGAIGFKTCGPAFAVVYAAMLLVLTIPVLVHRPAPPAA